MTTAVNANEKIKKNSVRSIFKDEVKLIIDKRAFVLKFMIIK